MLLRHKDLKEGSWLDTIETNGNQEPKGTQFSVKNIKKIYIGLYKILSLKFSTCSYCYRSTETPLII